MTEHQATSLQTKYLKGTLSCSSHQNVIFSILLKATLSFKKFVLETLMFLLTSKIMGKFKYTIIQVS